jgi:hypothetical protein
MVTFRNGIVFSGILSLPSRSARIDLTLMHIAGKIGSYGLCALTVVLFALGGKATALYLLFRLFDSGDDSGSPIGTILILGIGLLGGLLGVILGGISVLSVWHFLINRKQTHKNTEFERNHDAQA